MKFTSALTFTTAISIMSAVHSAPTASQQDTTSDVTTIHYRRHSSVSELSGRDFHGPDIMQNLNAAFEPGNGIKSLFHAVKRQLGGGSAASSASSSSSTTTESSTEHTDNRVTDGGNGLMGGDISSAEEAGFAYEPGQGLTARPLP